MGPSGVCNLSQIVGSTEILLEADRAPRISKMSIMVIKSLLAPLSYRTYGTFDLSQACAKLTVLLVRAALHDDSVYSDPMDFRPERWLDDDGNLLPAAKAPIHPNKIVFGCGRR